MIEGANPTRVGANSNRIKALARRIDELVANAPALSVKQRATLRAALAPTNAVADTEAAA